MDELHHCYGNYIIYNRTTCFQDCCKLYHACRVRCGDRTKVFEYDLVDLIIDVVPKKEVLEILMVNYDISYNAAKLAIRRWKKKKM